MLVMAAASGILTAAGGYAHADSSAAAATIGSSGFGSGNAVQAPVDIPIDLCGNTVNVVGLLNPAVGNKCENEDDSWADDGYDEGADASDDGYDDDGYDDGADASAEGAAVDSSGVLSGNLIQAPVDVPVNVCGNTVDVIAALNPAAGNECSDESSPTPHYPPHHNPPHYPPTTHQPPSHHHHPDCPPEHHKPPHHKPPHHKPPHHKPPHHKPPHHKPPHHKPPHHRPPHHKPPVYNPPVSHQWPHHQWPHHEWNHHKWDHKKWNHKKWNHKKWNHKPPTLAHTGAGTDMGIAGGASAAMVIGGAWLMRRARGSQS
ncbi:chaplin [Streptomyces sp. NBC_00316]|uniref:chaplin n=1 Tax=Streptomyces sp. NBC_00316 TaxID=2975710 RepID=UPI002E2C8369|nr:chaplin [Streptomyces sp. NBC_00316]